MKTNKHRIKITLETPLSIGNDKSDQLSPLCDFIIKGREVLYIDPEKLGKLVLEKGIMDEFVTESGQLSNTRTRFILEEFIKTRLGTYPKKLLLHKFPMRGRPDRKMFIRPLLKSGGKPFIPGSTVKGAIKTALLYNWLCNSERGKSSISRIIGLIKSNGKSEKDKAFDLKKSFDMVIGELFGRLGTRQDKLHDFFCLRISDSSVIDKENIIISEVKRLHLVKAELQTPQYLESLKEKTSAEFELSVLPEINHRDLEFLNESDSGMLWNIINEFSRASLETDWEILDSHANDFGKNKGEETYNDLFDFFEKMTGEIGVESKTAHLRLGFGKTYFDNSLGLAIYKENKDIFMQYVRLLRLGKPRQTEFPVTRTVCTDPLVPMGWATLKY